MTIPSVTALVAEGWRQHPSWLTASTPPAASRLPALHTTRVFKRNLKRAEKRGKDLAKLWRIVMQLLLEQPLEPRTRPHLLINWNRSRCWECHIEPDWLLIWEQEDDALTLVRTGTHADLFG